MQYRIFNKRRNAYLDKNLYFLGQDGIVYKKSSPFLLEIIFSYR